MSLASAVDGRPGRVPYYLANLPSAAERRRWGITPAGTGARRLLAQRASELREAGLPDYAALLEPRELFRAARTGTVPRDRLAEAANVIFAADSRLLTTAQWAVVFRAADYIGSPPPPGPIRLYRGATARHRHGLAWTDSLELAADYAIRHGTPHVPRVWVARVPPDHILRRFPAGREWIVDTAGLAVHEYDGPPLVWDARLGRWTADPAGDAAKVRRLRELRSTLRALAR